MANQNQITITKLQLQNYNPYGKQEEREGKLERKRMSSTILIN